MSAEWPAVVSGSPLMNVTLLQDDADARDDGDPAPVARVDLERFAARKRAAEQDEGAERPPERVERLGRRE